MSINQLFELSRRSFRVYDAAMNTAGQNIANAGTEGYHRRRITRSAENAVSPGLSSPSPQGATGVGVSLQSYERLRDSLLESASWQARAGLGDAEEEARLLGALEGVIGTGSEGNLTDALGAFWNAWEDVANQPADVGMRKQLLRQSETLTRTFRRLDTSFDEYAANTRDYLSDSVDEVNGLLGNIAALNETVLVARQSGSPDLVAEDERDALVKELSQLIPARVQENAGGYTISTGGLTLVQGKDHEQLETFSADDSRVRLVSTGREITPQASDGGKLGAQLRVLQETLPEIRGELDAFVANLVDEVNDAHSVGFDLDDNTGADFFVAGGATAGTIELAIATPRAIAASGAPSAPGNSDNALDIASMREGFDADIINFMSGVGARVQQAASRASGRQDVVEHMDAMVQGTSAVSLDEEMTNLIENQQAYAASARVLNTAQEMMDTLLAL